MRNLKLTIAYDGTEYHGWQSQPGLATIQGEMETALAKLFNHEVSVNGSGRTDAGVHACGQVANVQTLRTMPAGSVLKGSNGLLPEGIRVLSVEDVADDFHARLSACSKTYEYRIWRRPIVSPFLCRYVYKYPYAMNASAIDDAGRRLLGTHDFTSFCAKDTVIENRVRTIFDIDWRRSDETWIFSIKGSGFLQRMVRTIVGTLLDIGQDRLQPECIPAILDAKDRSRAGPSAPAKGLHLIRVEY
jgi:tRNA pseudouridine38-40 synthase